MAVPSPLVFPHLRISQGRHSCAPFFAQNMKTATKPTTPPEKRARLTTRQWAEAETLWKNGDATYEDLGKRFNKHPDTFKKRFNKIGLKKGSNAAMHKERVAAAVNSASVVETSVLAGRIKESKERHYKMASGLSALIWAEVLKAKQNNVPFASIAGNLKALDIAAAALRKTQEQTWTALGLDKFDGIDEEELPELIISELTAEQIEALRSLDEDDGIVVAADADMQELDGGDNEDEGD